jgi:hypothetical protein
MPDHLQQAKDAIRAGDRETGKRLLLDLLHTDPQHEMAWLWLSEVVEYPENKVECLQRALAINPDNKAAQRGLARLQQQLAILPDEEPGTKSSARQEMNTLLEEGLVFPKGFGQAGVAADEVKTPSSPSSIVLLLSGLGLFIICAGLLAIIAFVVNKQFFTATAVTASERPTPNLVLTLESAKPVQPAEPTPIPTPVVSPTPAPTPTPTVLAAMYVQDRWVATQAFNGVVYFLFKFPARISRFDMNRDAWLSNIRLSSPPSAFAIDAEGVYVAYNRRVVRFPLDGGDEIPLYNAQTNINTLFTYKNMLYLLDSRGNVVSLDKLSGQQMDAGSYSSNIQTIQVAPSLQKAFAHRGYEILEIPLNDDGAIGLQSIKTYAPISGQRIGSDIFIFPDLTHLVDNSGTVYNTTNLSYFDNYAGVVHDLAFYRDFAIVRRQNILISISNRTMQEHGRYILKNNPLKIYVNSEFVYGFSHNPVQGLVVSKTPVGLVILR